MKVYFLRHAQSTWNAHKEWARDVPITDEGKEQAKKVVGFVHTVICSPLKRAKQTLKNSNLLYDKIIHSESCREIKNGTLCDYLEGEDANYCETVEDIDKRINDLKNIIFELKKENPNMLVGIVSHCGFIQYLTGNYLDNCQVLEHEFERDNK